MKFLAYQWQVLVIAITFLTRLPLPIREFSQTKLDKSSGYFGIVGLFIGVWLAFWLWFLSMYLPTDIAVILMMMLGFYSTGGFHEDGLADVCDGFGGGYSKTKKHQIMKDSRLGTYGALGLFSVLLLKFHALQTLANASLLVTLVSIVAMQSLSRVFATTFIVTTPYSDGNETNAKPQASKVYASSILLLLFTTSVSLSLIYSVSTGAIVLVFTTMFALLHLVLRKWFLHHISGYTGDCLGFSQQAFEILGYLILLIALEQI